MPTNPKALRAVADDKAPLEWLEPLANPPIARVMKHGGEKYGRRNYVDTPVATTTYVGAARRHIDAIALGEDFDPDSGEMHWAHIAACGAVMLAAHAAGEVIPVPAPASTLLSDRAHIEGDMDAKGSATHTFEGALEHPACGTDACCGGCPAAEPRGCPFPSKYDRDGIGLVCNNVLPCDNPDHAAAPRPAEEWRPYCRHDGGSLSVACTHCHCWDA